jgi:hypothetical protein
MLKLKTETDTNATVKLIITSIDSITGFYRAVDKHPLWPESLVYDVNEEHLRRSKTQIENELSRTRMFNDRDGGAMSTAATIFLEEWYEFLEAAIIKRDRAAARHELAQCMAMLLRIGAHLDDYVPEEEKGGDENAQTENEHWGRPCGDTPSAEADGYADNVEGHFRPEAQRRDVK